MTIGHRLNQALSIKKIKTSHIVDALDISQQYVSNLRKTSNLNNTVVAIAKQYDIDLNWLATGQGEMFLSKTIEPCDSLSQSAPDDSALPLDEYFTALKNIAKAENRENELLEHLKWLVQTSAAGKELRPQAMLNIHEKQESKKDKVLFPSDLIEESDAEMLTIGHSAKRSP